MGIRAITRHLRSTQRNSTVAAATEGKHRDNETDIASSHDRFEHGTTCCPRKRNANYQTANSESKQNAEETVQKSPQP